MRRVSRTAGVSDREQVRPNEEKTIPFSLFFNDIGVVCTVRASLLLGRLARPQQQQQQQQQKKKKRSTREGKEVAALGFDSSKQQHTHTHSAQSCDTKSRPHPRTDQEPAINIMESLGGERKARLDAAHDTRSWGWHAT
jgi:hypothetical protein